MLPSDPIDRNTKVQIGLATAMLLMMLTSMGQTYSTNQSLQLAGAGRDGRIDLMGEKISSMETVLGLRVTALEKSQDGLRVDIRTQINDLKTEVKEIAKRIP